MTYNGQRNICECGGVYYGASESDDFKRHSLTKKHLYYINTGKQYIFINHRHCYIDDNPY